MSILNRTIELVEPDQTTYRVSLPYGDEIEFRHIKGPDELTRMEAAAAEMTALIANGTAPKEMREQKIKDPLTIAQAHFMRHLYVASWRLMDELDADGKPAFEQENEPISFASLLDFAAKATFAFRGLWERVDQEITGKASMYRRKAIELSKKESAETPNTSPSSDLVESAGDATLGS